jgi:hypothetical protein
LHIPSSLSGQAVIYPHFLLGPGLHPILTLHPPVKSRLCLYWPIPVSQYLKLIPFVHLTHHPDDRGSTALLNTGKLLPGYTALQPRKEPSL